MAGRGDDSLGDKHYDADILLAYALDQLPPDQAAQVGTHVATCPACKAIVSEAQHLTWQIDRALHESLDSAQPSPNLRFDPISHAWHQPPRRVTYPYRLKRLTSGFVILPLLVLLALAITLLVSFEDSFARHNLQLTRHYSGPPALVAVALDGSIAIVRLHGAQTGIVREIRHAGNPHNLSFSPNGRWLAFRRGGTLHLVETRAEGLHVKLDLRESAAWAWSPDGAALAYTDGRGQLLRFDLASQTQTLLVPAADGAWGAPVWSPDGTQIAYAVPHGIWRVDPATGYRVELARNPTPDSALLAPAAWLDPDTLLLAWDARNGEQTSRAALYHVDISARQAVSLGAELLARGGAIVWPIGADGHALAVRGDRLVALDLVSDAARPVPEQLRYPLAAEWAPGGQWLATVLSEKRDGAGLILYAPDEARIVPIPLPEGAIEKSVTWAGPEHLFVLRQPEDGDTLELWLVSIAGKHKPQRILANVPAPDTTSAGWQWQDAIATLAVNS